MTVSESTQPLCLACCDGREISGSEQCTLKLPIKRFVGRKVVKSSGEHIQVGSEQTWDKNSLDEAVKNTLPTNYSFELRKTVDFIHTHACKHVALQFPEGLLIYATTIADIIETACPETECIIMGDVTYGACCIDDYSAVALDCDLLVHYAHSCLIPISVTKLRVLYIFVDIDIDIPHLVSTVKRNFTMSNELSLIGTIQFNSALVKVQRQLSRLGYNIKIPRVKPLSKGEVLGCTSPQVQLDEASSATTQNLLYIGDGRFHLESAMIQNPLLAAYRYDPYSRRLTKEYYDHSQMYQLRKKAIDDARLAKHWGIILGSLGRQGNPHLMKLIQVHLHHTGKTFVNVLISEIFPAKLSLMSDVECWVQIACPRLSIDWGYAFCRPLLTPYEALVALGVQSARWMYDSQHAYPMDFYGTKGLARSNAASVTQLNESL